VTTDPKSRTVSGNAVCKASFWRPSFTFARVAYPIRRRLPPPPVKLHEFLSTRQARCASVRQIAHGTVDGPPHSVMTIPNVLMSLLWTCPIWALHGIFLSFHQRFLWSSLMLRAVVSPLRFNFFTIRQEAFDQSPRKLTSTLTSFFPFAFRPFRRLRLLSLSAIS